MGRTVQAVKGELMFLITGATGNIGGKLVQLLSERGHPVRALVRDPARARFPAGVEAVVADLDEPDSVVRAAKGVDAIFHMQRSEERRVGEESRYTCGNMTETQLNTIRCTD